MFCSWRDLAGNWVDSEKIRAVENRAGGAGFRVAGIPGFQESRFCPETFECLQVGPRAWCSSVLPCSVLQKRAFQSLNSLLPQKSRPSFPFCINFTQNLYFSIFLHKNQKHIKVGKFLVFFYIKHMQKANNI